MNVEEILAFARGLLGDQRPPYLWPQDELLLYYNRSVDDVCRRVKHLRDSSTPSICQVPILSGIHTYAYSPKIVELISARLSSQSVPLSIKNEAWMDRSYSSWRGAVGVPSILIPEIENGKFRLYPYFPGTHIVTGASNISFDSGTKTIGKSDGGLSIFAAGDQISVTGTVLNGTDSLPALFQIATVSDTTLTVNETLTDEVDTSAVLRRVEDRLNLSVSRLPLEWVKISALSTSFPPIDEDFHFDLIHGILAKAYLKDGTETYDPNQGARHQALFEGMILRLKQERLQRLFFEHTIGPHPGTI